MVAAHVIDDLSDRILAGYPLLVTRTYEERRWEQEFQRLAADLGWNCVSWSMTGGVVADSKSSSAASETERVDPVAFLDQIQNDYASQHLFLLKDFHLCFDDPRVIRKLRDLVPVLPGQQKTLVLMGAVDNIPKEISKDVSMIDLPLPDGDDLHEILEAILNDPKSGIVASIQQSDREALVRSVLGLTADEARKAWVKSLRGADGVTDELFANLISEKRRFVQGASLLEFVALDEGIEDVGGLDGLKEWISNRSEAFSTDAKNRHIGNPKGVLLAGVQGCGKSLTARAIARMLKFPLIRMDLGDLLESGRGVSEQNLRDVLSTAETIAPAVLWIEEIDKAFAGFVGNESQDPTVSRIVGRFLTWLQEHTHPVFVVATANRIESLPPELLRRGRFDDLFFVDLPTYEERLAIFRIHLQKRGWNPEQFDLDAHSNATEGYSGAEIETLVNSAIIDSYAEKRILSDDDLQDSIERTVPLSITMEDEIFQLREWARTRCRPATLDHRVIRVMEEEARRGETPAAEAEEVLKWKQLAEYGQIPAAIIEFLRHHERVTWDVLLNEFADYTDVSGRYGLVFRSDPKVVVWTRMGRDLVDQLSDLIVRKRLYLHPCGEDLYQQASTPKLPVVSNFPDQRVQNPVWLPTELQLAPYVGGAGLYGRVARIKMGAPNS
ncbi:AAA family ATPase [Thalassoglobus sp. JC818]|uniref:AAA family ATPase n=1 Tax=Thalassoglobus sp. JC818 TaxID=3232136 RepID=UPI003457C09E